MADFIIFKTWNGVTKVIELVCLTIAMSTFFSEKSNIFFIGQSASYFIASMQVSSFLYSTFLLIVYVFGGLRIQKTLYELLVNAFYAFMLLTASIVLFSRSYRIGSFIASGIFSLFASLAYSVDTYLALVNLGTNLPWQPAAVNAVGGSSPGPTVYPGGGVGAAVGTTLSPEIRTQPFTPPPVYHPPPSLAGSGPYVVGGTGSSTSTPSMMRPGPSVVGGSASRTNTPSAPGRESVYATVNKSQTEDTYYSDVSGDVSFPNSQKTGTYMNAQVTVTHTDDPADAINSTIDDIKTPVAPGRQNRF